MAHQEVVAELLKSVAEHLESVAEFPWNEKGYEVRVEEITGVALFSNGWK